MFCGDWVHTDIVGKTCEHSGEESLSECEDEGGWTAVEVQRCSRAVSGGDLLRSVRLGPFFSVPGQWRSLMTHSLRGLLNDGDRVVSFVGAPVTEAGTRIGFPPLHVHHVHVRKPERSGAMQPPVGRERASHWFETHGDYSRGDDFGVGARSAAGYATRLPEGHCYVVTSAEQIDLNAEVNDVRVDASGASELSYYLEAAFTLAPDADCKPVSKFWLRRPRSRELPTDVWERYAAPSTDSVTWWSGKMPSSGRLLHAWLHTHRSRFGGANHSACPAPTSACEVAQPRSPPLGLQGCCSWPRGRRWSTVPRSASRLLTASTWRRCATRASRAQRWRRRRAWSARTTRRNQTRCEPRASRRHLAR